MVAVMGRIVGEGPRLPILLAAFWLLGFGPFPHHCFVGAATARRGGGSLGTAECWIRLVLGGTAPPRIILWGQSLWVSGVPWGAVWGLPTFEWPDRAIGMVFLMEALLAERTCSTRFGS